MNENNITCHNCGAPLASGALICENCGSSAAATMRISPEQLEVPQPVESGEKKSYETMRVEAAEAAPEVHYEEMIQAVRTESPVEVPAEFLEIPQPEPVSPPAPAAPVRDVFAPLPTVAPAAPKKSSNAWVIALVVFLVVCCCCVCLAAGSISVLAVLGSGNWYY